MRKNEKKVRGGKEGRKKESLLHFMQYVMLCVLVYVLAHVCMYV